MFTGCGTALVTPFRRDLSLDEATLRGLVRRQIEAGINFLVPCGTTGESPTLNRAEQPMPSSLPGDWRVSGRISGWFWWPHLSCSKYD